MKREIRNKNFKNEGKVFVSLQLWSKLKGRHNFGFVATIVLPFPKVPILIVRCFDNVLDAFSHCFYSSIIYFPVCSYKNLKSFAGALGKTSPAHV